MVQIHEFDPVIYPFTLWVAIFNSEEDDVKIFNEKFTDGYTGKEMKSEMILSHGGVTFFVGEKGNDVDKGILIVFNGAKHVTVKNIAHESTHASQFVWGFLGESPAGDEADAYLVGWVAKCIEEVKDGKAS